MKFSIEKQYFGKLFKQLYTLNAISIQEGLFLLLRKYNLEIKDILSQNRSIVMVMFAPVIEVNFDQELESQSLSKAAKDFCVTKQLDSNFCKVFVRNIGFAVRDRDFWDFFEYFGKVLRATIVRDRKTRRSKGYGFVVFSNPLDAERAVNAKKHEITLEGRLLVVKKAEKRSGGKDKKNRQEVFEEAVNYFREEEEKISVEVSKAEEQNNCYINMLHDELFFHIFSYLDLKTKIKMELVCKRWRKVSLDNWNCIHYLNFKGFFNTSNRLSGLDDNILVAILKKGCNNLKSIDLSASPYVITKISFFMIGKVGKQLQQLNISRTCIQNKAIKYLGENLLQLQVLKMDRCLNVGEKGFWWMFKDLKHLEILSVTESSRLVGKCLFMLHPSLKVVDFSYCSRLNDGGIGNLTQSCPNLSSVNLSFCISLTDQSLVHLSQRCRLINHLNLCGLSKTVTHQGFITLKELNALIKLNISRNINVNDEVIEVIGISCTRIQSFNIEACHPHLTCAGINALSYYDNLIELNISYINEVCDICISGVSVIHRLQTLLTRCCTKLTNNGVSKCLLHLQDLKLFDLSSCYLIDDSLINFEEMQPRCQDIEIILGGTSVTENGVAAICQKLICCKASLLCLSNGMLRNDRDPTSAAPFFPESDDEDEDDEDEKELEKIIAYEPSFSFDITSPLSNIDEYGEPLWVIEKSQNLQPNLTQNTISNENIKICEELVTVPSSKDIINHVNQNKSKNSEWNNETDKECDMEDWDAEVDEHRVWEIPADTLAESYGDFNEDEYALMCDDGFNELFG